MGASAGSILGVPLLLLSIERLGLASALAATATFSAYPPPGRSAQTWSPTCQV